jgi:uncharacterized RDD family membrane protein YckC
VSTATVTNVDLYTGAPVVLVHAGRGARLVATIVDILFQTFIFALFAVPLAFMGAMVGDSEPSGGLALVLMGLGFVIGFFAGIGIQGFLLAKSGQTVGKKLFKIRIVDPAGRQPTAVKLFVMRTILPIFICQVPVLGMLFNIGDSLAIFRDNYRCLHDDLADTYVIDIVATEAATAGVDLAVFA